MRICVPKDMGDTTGGGRYISPACEIAGDRNTLVYEAASRFRPLWELDSVSEFKGCYAGIVESMCIRFYACEVD